MFFLVKESRRRRKNFQDLVSDLKENLLKIAFLMLKTPKIFACGADLPLLLDQICISFACDIDFLVFALSFQSKNSFLFD